MRQSLLALILVSLSAQADVVTTPPTPEAFQAKRGTTNVGAVQSNAADCWKIVYADVETRKVGANYSCVGTSKATLTYKAPAPCGAAPASQTQEAQCPSGTTGTFTQVKTWTSKPAPVCWELAAAWSPTTPPAGACPAAPVASWTFLGFEGAQYTVPANSVVRFGYDVTWVQKTLSGTFDCTWEFFGDPLPGKRKQCEVAGGPVTPPPPPVTGKATLSWSAPTTNADGTPLTDLAGYRVWYGPTSGTYTQALPVSATNAVVDGLAVGQWFFVVRAIDTSGNESASSAEVSKTVQ